MRLSRVIEKKKDRDVGTDPIAEMVKAQGELREELQENNPQASRVIATKKIGNKTRRIA
jgi:hypothetical protein